MKNYIALFLIFAFLSSCNNKKGNDVQNIVDNAIETAGGEKFQNFKYSFDFRNMHYVGKREGGNFRLERQFTDSIGKVIDIRSNNKFERFINGELAIIPDSMAFKYTNSVNSVHYFALLPYGLNDGAALKSYLGEVLVKGNKYHKIKVTFQQEGGGKDFEDIFIYWFDKIEHKLDYMAYSYITDGGGMRFREAYNERYVGGVRFLDYNNYKPIPENAELINLDELFETNQLKLLSKIELQNISVE